MKKEKFSAWMVAGVTSLVLLTGCASTSQTAVSDPYDPYESVNRKIYAFNSGLDEWVLLPVTKGYRAVMPGFAQEGVSNMISNVGEPNNTLNNFLQGKVNEGIETTFRFLVNTTFGIGGLFDVASWIGMEKHEEDFGQTLGTWGVGEGSYLVLPLFGPSSTRDVWRWPVSVATNPLTYVFANDHLVHEDAQWSATLGWAALSTVNLRSQMIDAGYDQMRANTVDEYVAVRDAYRRVREKSIHGNDRSSEDELKTLTPLVRDED